jgi:hypothetical protein
MPQPISETKGLLFTPAFDTYVPALGESANIQDALELFYYGNSTNGNTIDGTNSIYANLIDFNNRLNANDISTHANANAAHGATGAVVGTTNIQTLTNKTLTSPKINENVALTATATELNVLDGITTSTTELNYVYGVTSGIQEQIDLKPTLRYEGNILDRNIFVQAAEPTAVNIGDIWIDF